MKHALRTELRLTVLPQIISCFLSLMSRGFRIRAQVGCSIHDLLRHQVGIDERLLEAHVQTVFLNGRAVDDLHQSIVEDGCALSLSGALPGLIGAAFRKSGFYSGLRKAVSFHGQTVIEVLRPGSMTLKLFNLTGPTLGPYFLSHGIEISGKDLEEVIQTCTEPFFEGLRHVRINGRESTAEEIGAMDLKNQTICLFVEPSTD